MPIAELDPLADRRNAHVVKLVKPILEDTSHPALKGLFRVEEDGSVTNDLKSCITIGNRRFVIFAKNAYNATLSLD